MKAKRGFTLVEILIVVVILGILAAIVIPQFTEASTEAKASSLMTDLQTVRSQIELYKIQHNDDLPGAGGATFVQALTGKTDIDGAVAAAGAYGPYLQKIPTNQFNDNSSVRSDGAAAGANTDGWRFDTTSGDFRADDTAAHAAL
jgi:general secretion pathway protein G